MYEKPDDIIYAYDERPPWHKLLMLSIQYAVLLSFYFVIVAIVFRSANVSEKITATAISISMIVVAITTIMQSLRNGILGSGYLAAPVVSAIYLDAALKAIEYGGLPTLFAMTIFAGLIEIFLSRILHRLRKLFPPTISGFIICIVGIKLGLIGIQQVLGVQVYYQALFGTHLTVALITLAIMVGFSVWGKDVARLMCSMIGLALGFIIAIFSGLVPEAKLQLIKHSSYFALPIPTYLHYHFDIHLMVPFIIAAIAASLRVIGVITTCQKINDANWIKPDMKTIKSGMLADGIGCTLAGLLGTSGISAGPSLVGVSKATGATSRYIGFGAAAILLIMSLIPKVAYTILSLPHSVVGAGLVFTASFMIMGGIQIILSRNIDARATYVVGISLLLGLSREIFKHFYNNLPSLVQIFTTTSMSIATISAVLLNLLFRFGIKQHANLVIESKQLSAKEVEAFMQTQGKKWQINQEVLQRCIDSIAQVIDTIEQAKLAKQNVDLVMTYDQIDLSIKISYIGTLLSMPYVSQKHPVFLEEEAFSYGLADFMTNVYPDHFEYHQDHDKVSLHFVFHV